MKAIVQHTYGAPLDVLHLEDLDRPQVRADGVLLRVHAAGVNWADWAVTRGVPYMLRAVTGVPRPRNPVRGTDVAGTVEVLGGQVTTLRPGDEVFGWCDGAFAEKVAVPAGNLVTKPPDITFEQAASIPMAGFVALQALRDIAKINAGDKVLINGASGGIGTFSIQIARWLGAEVTGVCSTPNLDLVTSLGADHVIDYTREDFTRGAERYDLILDMADTHTLRERRQVLTRTGTLIPNSGAGGRWLSSVPRIAKARLVSPFVSQTLRPFFSLPSHDDLAVLQELVASGDVTPVVGRTYPLVETPDAVEHVGGGHVRGKVVVTI